MSADTASPSGTGTFYLVLQGEIAIFTDFPHRKLRLLAPDIPEHAYLAGPWLAETRIPKGGRLGLQNVSHGSMNPRDSKLFFDLPNARPRLEFARLHVEVPFPKEICHGLFQVNNNVKIEITDDEGVVTPQKPPDQVAIIPILVYDWDLKNKPVIVDLFDDSKVWESSGPNDYYRALHIYASGVKIKIENDLDHAQKAFHAAAALMGVNARISGEAESREAYPPDGLAACEVNLTLAERMTVAEAFGKCLQEGQTSIDIDELIRKTLAAEDRPPAMGGSCGPMTG